LLCQAGSQAAQQPLFLGLEAVYAGAPPQWISAPFQTRLGAVDFIFLHRKQQRQGWQPLGWLQQEALYTVPPFPRSRKPSVWRYSFITEVILYCPKPAAIYTGASIVMLSRQPRLHSSPCSSGWRHYMPPPPFLRTGGKLCTRAHLSCNTRAGGSPASYAPYHEFFGLEPFFRRSKTEPGTLVFRSRSSPFARGWEQLMHAQDSVRLPAEWTSPSSGLAVNYALELI